MEGEPGYIPRHLRNAKPAVFLTTLLAALSMSDDSGEQPSSRWMALQDVPARVADPDVTFRGDVDPDLIESFRFAEVMADRYWDSLGYEESECEDELTVTFTDEFADPNDRTPNREPLGAADPATCREWLNSEEFADDPDPWPLAYTHTHEKGHLRKLGHSKDPDSLMYSDEETDSEKPPPEATIQRFERMFDVETGRDSDRDG